MIVGRSCFHKCFETAGPLSKLPGAPEGLEPLGLDWASGRSKRPPSPNRSPAIAGGSFFPDTPGDVAEGGADRDLG